MKTKMTAILTIIAVLASLEGPVFGQLPATSKSTAVNYRLSGNVLAGTNNRTAKDDFPRFFPKQNSGTNSPKNISDDDPVPYTGFVQIGNQVELRRNINEPLADPNSVIFPQADQSFSANDGFKVEVTK